MNLIFTVIIKDSTALHNLQKHFPYIMSVEPDMNPGS